MEILIGVRRRLEARMHCRFSLDVLPEVVSIYDRFERTSVLPGKAAAALARLFSSPIWPVTLDEMPAQISFRDITADDLAPGRVTLRRGGLEIGGVVTPHPDGGTAWRIDEPSTGTALVFATDLEWSAANLGQREELLSLCREPFPARLLIMDGHFKPAELVNHTGWGHSSTSDALAFAEAAGVGQLVFFHHDPWHSDAILDDIYGGLQESRGLPFTLRPAVKGESLEIG